VAPRSKPATRSSTSPRAPGQDEVQKHQVDVLAQRLALALRAIARAGHRVPLCAEPARHEIGDRGLVLDDKDAHEGEA
jgi:hypothetical protein